MSTNVSSQEIRQDVLHRFRVTSCDVTGLLTFGEEMNYCFLLEEEKGVLEKPLEKGNWVFGEYDPKSNMLHPMAELILGKVQQRFPIRQIIFAYEVSVPEVKPQAKPHIQLPNHTAKTVTSLARFTLMLAAGAVMVAGYAFLSALSAIDPKLIVVLDTGAEEKELPWVCLMSWEQKPES